MSNINPQSKNSKGWQFLKTNSATNQNIYQ